MLCTQNRQACTDQVAAAGLGQASKHMIRRMHPHHRNIAKGTCAAMQLYSSCVLTVQLLVPWRRMKWQVTGLLYWGWVEQPVIRRPGRGWGVGRCNHQLTTPTEKGAGAGASCTYSLMPQWLMHATDTKLHFLQWYESNPTTRPAHLAILQPD